MLKGIEVSWWSQWYTVSKVIVIVQLVVELHPDITAIVPNDSFHGGSFLMIQ